MAPCMDMLPIMYGVEELSVRNFLIRASMAENASGDPAKTHKSTNRSHERGGPVLLIEPFYDSIFLFEVVLVSTLMTSSVLIYFI